MKVSLYNSIEISDEQRVQLARLIDGQDAKKRQATRDEIKDFAWEIGSQWEIALAMGELESPLRDAALAAVGDPDTGMSALIGDPDTELDDLLGLDEPVPSLEDLL